MAQVIFENVTKTFMGGRVIALKEVSLEVPHRRFITVLGPSGCGKSTLLRVVAGMEQPDSGQIRIGERVVNAIPPGKRNVAMVFQNYALYPHMRVYDNIAIGLKLHKYPAGEIQGKVSEVSGMLGIRDLLKRYPRQLSGGQQQRVALARALVREPEVFLLDEPLSNLDAQIREQTRAELKRLFRDLGATVLYVTHDQAEAMSMSDIVVVIEKGEIRQIGDPETIYNDPQHQFVAEFVGMQRINILEGNLRDGDFISADETVVIPLGTSHKGAISLGIRPESIHIGAGAGIDLTAVVTYIEPLGPSEKVFVKIGENELRVVVEADSKVEIGDTLTITFSPKDVFLFDARTGGRMYIE
ncbi:MAG: ABC transporter ATP-binding protein [Deltaproteobacteria bacterium]|nr:ABC transporter ATP-binding protein [Deltaproteobacteria bacterium]